MFNLSLTNFQIHDRLDISVDGFTVVEGISSSGKSAIRRALQTLFKNSWNSSYLKSGEKSCRIVFEKDGNRVEYDRPANTYTFNGQVYSKLGRGGVPVEFADWGFKDLEIGDDSYDVIFASQLDPLFLVSYKTADINRILGRIFDVERYKLAGQLVQKDIQSCKVSLSKAKSDLLDLETQVAQYKDNLDFVVELDDSISHLTLIDEYLNLLSSVESINGILGVIQAQVEELSDLMSNVSSCQDIEDFCGVSGVYNVDVCRLSVLQSGLDEMESLRFNLVSYVDLNEYLDMVHVCEVDEGAVSSIGQVERDLRGIGDAIAGFGLVSDYFGFVRDRDVINSDLLDLDNKMLDLEEERDDILMQGVCPSCGLPYDRNS